MSSSGDRARFEMLFIFGPTFLSSPQMDRVGPVTPRWAIFGSLSQSRPQQLHVAAPALRPTCYIPQPSMGPLDSFLAGKWFKSMGLFGAGVSPTCSDAALLSAVGIPVSLRLQIQGAQPPTRLPSWSCSLGQGAPDTRLLQPQVPLPHTSCKEAPSHYPTLGLGATWMWVQSLCTELLLGGSPSACLLPQTSSSLPPGLLPLPLAPSPRPNGCLEPPPTPTSHFDFTPTPLWLQSSG